MPQPDLKLVQRQQSRLAPIWKPYVYEGKLTLLDGLPGTGKTAILCDLAARLSTGGPLPLSKQRLEPRRVVLAVTEDDLEDTILPRLEAARADLSRIELLDDTLDFGSSAFEKLLRRRPILMLETLLHHLPAGTMMNDEASVRAALHPLMKGLRDSRTGCIGVKHWNKKVSLSYLLRSGGSVGFAAVPRIVMSAVAGKEGQHYLINSKNNVAPAASPLVYELKEAGETVRVEWLRVEDGLDPDLTPTVDRVVTFLRELFKDSPVLPAKTCRRALMEAGFGQHTIEQAASYLRIVVQKTSKIDGPWVWIFGGNFSKAKIVYLRQAWERENLEKASK